MEEIKRSMMRLDGWFEKNGWKGYDPYDIRATGTFRLMQKNKYTHFVAEKAANIFPGTMRHVFFIKPKLYPLVPMHMAHAYMNMHECMEDEKYIDKAKSCIRWLEGNSWSEPFDWQSKIFIPKGTPDAYNIVNICNLFLRTYRLFNNPKYLKIAKDSCDFLVTGLNIDNVRENEVCFSYTPLDNFHVHNVNLCVASLLYKVGAMLEKREYIDLARKSANYTINCQNKDGSWYYWGPPEQSDSIDNYHTAFLLSSLFDIYQTTKDKRILSALDRGYAFYVNNLFVDNAIPKAEKNNRFPTDIHACAHSILFLCSMAKRYPDSMELAINVAKWTINNMQDTKGYFFYRICASGKIDKSAYVRWAEAPMLNALSRLLLTSSIKHNMGGNSISLADTIYKDNYGISW